MRELRPTDATDPQSEVRMVLALLYLGAVVVLVAVVCYWLVEMG